MSGPIFANRNQLLSMLYRFLLLLYMMMTNIWCFYD